LDFVPNHTSDQRPGFLESRSSRDNPKHEWYIWRDPAPDGGPPNNWEGWLGPAWEYDKKPGQYYLRQFRKEQPELNYRHPAVLPEMLNIMRFWLDKGVDGFRVDVIALLGKDNQFRDQPANPDFRPGQPAYRSQLRIYTEDQPVTHDYIRAMRRVLDDYNECMMLGELDPIQGLMSYYGAELDECHLPFNFHLLYTPWDAEVVRRTVDAYDAGIPLGACPNWVLGNHDQPRIASRAGKGRACVAQMLLLTLKGTAICYYGDEIGMMNVNIPPEKLRDTVGYNPSEAKQFSRDPWRTPMQWDADPNAGFCPTNVEPWLPIAEDYRRINVAVQDQDPRSMLALFRRLTALRREIPALYVGSYRSLDMGVSAVFAYERRHTNTRMLIILNFSDLSQILDLRPTGTSVKVLLSTELDREGVESLEEFHLRANEGVIVQIL
jgi:alpha-glucosidase